MKLLVTGGRNYYDHETIFRVLDKVQAKKPITLFIAGDADGLDFIATAWAYSRKIPVEIHCADWEKHGKAAGPKRNTCMVNRQPDIAVAFPGGAGTANCVNQLERAKVPVVDLRKK